MPELPPVTRTFLPSRPGMALTRSDVVAVSDIWVAPRVVCGHSSRHPAWRYRGHGRNALDPRRTTGRMDTTHVIEAMRAGRRAHCRRRLRSPYGLSADTHQGRRVCCLSSFAHDLHATFAPDTAMLGVSLRHRGEELLALP